MKNDLKKLKARGGWFDVEIIGNHRGGIGNHAMIKGARGFARRNTKQPDFLQIIAPIESSPDQIHAFYVPEYDAARLIKIIAPAINNDEANRIWLNIWANLGTLHTYDLKSLRV